MSWTLIADIGGTNLRLARSFGSQIKDLTVLPTRGEGDILDAFSAYCATHGTPSSCCIAVAAVIENGVATMTNARQVLRSNDLKIATGTQNLWLINDFEAAAWYLMSVSDAKVDRLCGPSSIQAGTRVVIGPGTGLGVGMLAYQGSRSFVVPSEGGHMHIAPVTKSEAEVFSAFRSIWPEFAFGDTLALEAEAFLSGIGLPKLYSAVCSAHGTRPEIADIQEILAAPATAEIDETLQIFKSHLGRFCGDLALGFMARGGVYLTGGVARKNPWLFDSIFVDAFQQGGRFTKTRQEFGLYLCRDEQTGLVGARNAGLSLGQDQARRN